MTPAALATALLLASAPAPRAEKQPFEVHGRFEAREKVSSVQEPSRQPWRGDFGLARARLGVDWKKDDVEVVLEADLEGKPELKDAWAKLDVGRGAAVRAGQFKMPISALERESSWELPTARRGEIHAALEDGLQVTGRRPGAEAAWKAKSRLDPRVSAGVWQSLGADGKAAPGEGGDLFGQAAGARVSISPGPVTLGASGAWRSMEPMLGAEPERHWAAGADLAIDHDAGGRAWIEGLAGSSPLGISGDATFAVARAALAWRFGGAAKNAPYVEPFALAGALDPDAEIEGDLLVERAIGVNAGRWERWRVQLQLEESGVARNFPPLLAERARVASRRMALLQMGVSF